MNQLPIQRNFFHFCPYLYRLNAIFKVLIDAVLCVCFTPILTCSKNLFSGNIFSLLHLSIKPSEVPLKTHLVWPQLRGHTMCPLSLLPPISGLSTATWRLFGRAVGASSKPSISRCTHKLNQLASHHQIGARVSVVWPLLLSARPHKHLTHGENVSRPSTFLPLYLPPSPFT